MSLDSFHLTAFHIKCNPYKTFRDTEKNVGKGDAGLQNFLLLSILFAYFPLSDGPRRRLAVIVDSARKQDETTESSALFFNEMGVQHHHTGPRFKVTSERQLG